MKFGGTETGDIRRFGQIAIGGQRGDIRGIDCDRTGQVTSRRMDL